MLKIGSQYHLRFGRCSDFKVNHFYNFYIYITIRHFLRPCPIYIDIISVAESRRDSCRLRSLAVLFITFAGVLGGEHLALIFKLSLLPVISIS